LGKPAIDPSSLILFQLEHGPPWEPEDRHELWNGIEGGETEARFLADLAAYLAENDQPERSVELLRLALQWDGDSPVLWHNLGTSLLLLGEAQEAADVFSVAVRRFPASVELRYALARAYLEGDVPARAVIELRRVLTVRPDFGQAHYDLARAATAMEDWPLVVRALESYLAVEPNPPDRPQVLTSLDTARRLAEGKR
jgi:predicted Zn-dependent protease